MEKFRLNVIILLLVTVGVVNVISWRSEILAHELTHQAIFTAFGVESKIVMHDLGFSGETVPLNDFSSGDDRRTANLLHAQNELITYHFFPSYVSSLVLQLILIFTIYTLGHRIEHDTADAKASKKKR